MKVFVDTCAYCALTIPTDRLHNQSLQLLELIREARAQVYTSNFVLAELYTLLNVRAGHRVAVAFMDRQEQGGTNVLQVSSQTEEEARRIFRKYTLPRLSYVDCTSFALVNAHRLDHLFSFDTHFSQFKFNHAVTLLNTN